MDIGSGHKRRELIKKLLLQESRLFSEAKLIDYYKVIFQAFRGPSHFINESSLEFLREEIYLTNINKYPILVDISGFHKMWRVNVNVVSDGIISLDAYAEAHFNLGTALSQNGQTDEAILHFLKAIDIKPDMADTHISLANLYYSQGKLDTAIVHYRNALEIKPGSVQAHANLANALMGKGRTDEAIDHYRKAIEYDPGVPETYNNLGTALIVTGDIRLAVQCFQRALILRPGYESAENNLRRLEQLTAPSP
jgi:tetratricopeptide (TPR) repeat protein